MQTRSSAPAPRPVARECLQCFCPYDGESERCPACKYWFSYETPSARQPHILKESHSEKFPKLRHKSDCDKWHRTGVMVSRSTTSTHGR